MCPSCLRGVDSVEWGVQHSNSNRAATTAMLHLAGTIPKVVVVVAAVQLSCEHRRRLVVSVGAAAVPVPGKFMRDLKLRFR